ncbi:MAG TPA: DNA translocase FtsK [Ktedonobacterales bacterium]|nr:DNA translocase FtsK [Ktedonobacterales bacterium]
METPTKTERKAPAKPGANKNAKTPPARAPRRKKPATEKPTAPPTRDTAVIDWILSWPSHVKQGVAAVVLLLFTIVLAVGLLTRQHSQSPLATLGNAFHALLGVGTPLLVVGLIALAIANLAEAATQTKIVRLGLVIQLAILGFLLVLESRLLFGGNTGQLVGALLIEPLAGFPRLAQQVIVVGAIVIVLLLVFRVSWSQTLLALRWLVGGLGALVSASFGALAGAMGAARARRAARMLAADEPGDEESLSLEEDEDLASLALQPAAVPVAAGARPGAGRARQANQQARPEKAARRSGAAAGAGEADLDPLPPLPPLPMKPGAPAKAAPGKASGPLPAVGATVHYELPEITLLNGVVEQRQLRQEDMIEELARKVERTLRSFRVDAEVRRSDISVGPTVIRVGIRPLEKVKKDYRGHVVLDDDGQPVLVRTRVSRIMALQNDLALDLEAKSIRMEAPVPGRPYVGVEIPNKQSRLVTLREILASKDYEESRRKSRLTIALGRDVTGRARIGDLARFPHLLIAGTTGAGKSVCLSSIIACILMQATPEDVRFLMVDPKMVELTGFNGIPHLLAPVVTDVDHVIGTLKRGIIEMERRYRLFSKLGVRNLDAYRKLCLQRQELETLPNIVIIIDELADLMMSAPEEVESLICRLAQLARATGIHLVVATQRPSVDVITGLIKANFPTRISFMVSSSIDSRTILDMGGAERLLGRGDMLYLPVDAGKPERVQGTFLADDELERIVEHWRQTPPRPVRPEQSWEPIDDEDEEHHPEDDLLPQAEQMVREAGKATITLLRRRLGVGYARAGRLIDLLEAHGVIGPDTGSGRPREIIAPETEPSSDARLSGSGPFASGAGTNRTGAGTTGWQSDTMVPGNLRNSISPGNNLIQTPPQPPAGPHAPGHAQARPDKRNSGISNARDWDEDVEELEL